MTLARAVLLGVIALAAVLLHDGRLSGVATVGVLWLGLLALLLLWLDLFKHR